MSKQKQHILLGYFKTLSFGSSWDLNPRPPARQTRAYLIELTGQRLVYYHTVIIPSWPLSSVFIVLHLTFRV